MRWPSPVFSVPAVVKAVPAAPHHPAAFILAVAFVSKHACFFELGESRIPKMQMQDFALARQEVVFDVETVHRLKMAAQHRSRNQLGDCSRFARRVFDGVQRFATRLQVCFVLLVPLRNARIQIPTVVIEARLLS